MAKRFTDTNKYRKPFLRGLQGAYKLLWDYLYHDCDNAGIWIVDFEIAQTYIGKDMLVEKDQALKNFNSDELRIIEIDGGKKWFIPSFITFQYQQLSESNRAHTGVILTLKKFNLLNHDLSIKILTSPLQGAMEKDKDKDKEKEKEKEKEKLKEAPIELIFPFTSDKFMQYWNILIKEKKWKGKSIDALQASLKILSEFSESDAIEMMLKSIAGGYQGVFPLDKKQNYGKQTNSQTTPSGIAEELRKINERANR